MAWLPRIFAGMTEFMEIAEVQHALELLTPEEMGRADHASIEAGIAGRDLMEHAGGAVSHAVLSHVGHRRSARVRVLCGPGNNGGDGFVAARHLAEAGLKVSLFLLGARDRLSGDAAWAASLWEGETKPLEAALDRAEDADIWVDALFGAGLSRPLEGTPADLAEATRGADVLAVDIPSGVDGATGEIVGTAFRAVETVTFACFKPGHLLYPGRDMCGALTLADIGIPARVIREIGSRTFLNAPGLWRAALPPYRAQDHKYDRGHVGVASGGPSATGAARLSARAALRVGAGLVSILCPPAATLVHVAHLTAIMLKPWKGADDIGPMLERHRISTIVAGPAFGTDEDAHARLHALLSALQDTGGGAVLDADAITLLAQGGKDPTWRLPPKCVLTPHDGEFARLFPGIEGTRLDRARKAAEACGAVVVLKGPDTVVAHPDGRACINANAPGWLATAGSGDVLAGLVAGLMAQGMERFEAAAAGVWIHGATAAGLGPGMIAEDLPEHVPEVLRGLHGSAGRAPPIRLTLPFEA